MMAGLISHPTVNSCQDAAHTHLPCHCPALSLTCCLHRHNRKGRHGHQEGLNHWLGKSSHEVAGRPDNSNKKSSMIQASSSPCCTRLLPGSSPLSYKAGLQPFMLQHFGRASDASWHAYILQCRLLVHGSGWRFHFRMLPLAVLCPIGRAERRAWHTRVPFLEPCFWSPKSSSQLQRWRL